VAKLERRHLSREEEPDERERAMIVARCGQLEGL